MPRDINGTYTRTNGTFTGPTVWNQDDLAGVNIVSTIHDTHDQDIADALTGSVARDGSGKMQANFLPETDNTFSLGTQTDRWTTLHLSTSVRWFNGAQPATLQPTVVTGARIYTLPDETGTVVLKDGSDILQSVDGIEFDNSGFTLNLQPSTLTGNRNITLPDVDGELLTAASPDFPPVGTNPNDAGRIRLLELAANGTDYVGVQAPDAITTSFTVRFPDATPNSGEALVHDGTVDGSIYNLVWQAPGTIFGPVGTNPGDGGRVQLQELAANGSELVRIKAPDSIAASFDLTMPDALPAGNERGLIFDSSGVGTYTDDAVATQTDARQAAYVLDLIGLARPL